VNNTMTTIMSDQAIEIKCGFMKKMKTMKRKFFVLTKEQDGTVWLDYYDNVKRYEASNRIRSKKAISITDCFSINQRPVCADKNKQHAINVFTAENCFSLVLDDESQLSEWMDELRKQRKESQSSIKKKDNKSEEDPEYLHVWQVVIAKKGLGLPPHGITGLYRVCLTPKTIHLYKVDPTEEQIRPLEFPLNSIRKCARTGDFFSVELGRGSTIGAGELLMETDDPATAKNMQETIRDTMHAAAESSGSSHRPRSSTGDGARTRRATLGHINAPSAAGLQIPHAHSAQTTSTPLTPITAAFSNASAATSGHTSASASNTSIYASDVTSSGPFAASSFRDRCDSEPAQSNPRSRCISEGNSQLHYTTVSISQHRPGSGHRINSSSPPCASLNHSTESVGSFCQSEDYAETDATSNHPIPSYGKPASLPLYPHREVHIIPSQPSIQEQDGEDSGEAYMVMGAPKLPQSMSRSNGPDVEQSAYVIMSPSGSSATSSTRRSPSTEVDAYVDMSPAKPQTVVENGYLTMTLGSPHSSSSSNPAVDVDEGYLNMAPLAPALPAAAASMTTTGASGRMNAGTDVIHHHHHHRTRHHRSYQEAPEPPRESLEKLAQEFPLAPVKSFFTPAEEPADLIKPVRAYSIGSRPKPHHHVLMKDQDLSQTNWYGRDAVTGNAAAASDDTKGGAPGDAARVRAYSMGSRSAAGSHFRMNQPLRKRALTQDSVISSSSTNVIPETTNETASPASSS
jgi:hypothetical protein